MPETENKESRIDWSKIRVGDLIICNCNNHTKFSVLVLEFLKPNVFSGMISGHSVAPMLNHKIQMFAQQGAIFFDESWTFDIVPGSGKISE